jgi:hypothetical protein
MNANSGSDPGSAHLISRQWQRSTEIQQTLLETMHEMARSNKGSRVRSSEGEALEGWIGQGSDKE